ncbi:MAG: FAD binding domain-containing protein [Burkholderiales bacterium]|nr:FAD binding domain-containing protein [Burkholderiales bacterium]
MLTYDQYLTPRSLAEAFEAIGRFGAAARVVAGATDVLPWAREGRAGDVHYAAVIDVSRIPELCGVELRGERVRLGANTTIAAFLANPVLVEHAPVLKHCAVWFADDQIREQATLAGNLVNASPAADATPAMLAMNSVLTLYSSANGQVRTRSVPLDEFVLGPGQTRLQPGELVGSIECDSMAGYGAAFEKVGHRRSLVISTVCVAALVRLDFAQRDFDDVRIAVAAVGPVPTRLTECEAFLQGKPVQPDVIRGAAELAADRVQSRTRREYRREVLVNFVERSITDALAELGISVSSASATKEVQHA